MNSAITSDLQAWKGVFSRELSTQLEQLREDQDIYAFALEVPEDLGNPDISTVVGRESKLIGEKRGSLTWLNRRYSPVEWGDYLPNAIAFHQTNDLLEQICNRHKSVFSDEEGDDTPEGLEFQDALYSACLEVMAQCDAEGSFGHIWFKIIFMSDGEHPIIRESFLRLNTGRGLKEAAVLFAED